MVFHGKFVISLLLVSTLNHCLANSYVDDVIAEGKLFKKILSKFWKVPWINLNSSWKNEVTSACGNDITTLFESADAGEMWALKMLDATSKIPPGLLVGNIRELGIYDECVQVKSDDNSANIQGRHCMVSMAMPTKFVSDPTEVLFIQKQSVFNPTPDIDLNFAATLCFPSSCDVDDIASFVNASIRSTQDLAEFQVRVAQVTCSRIDSEVEVFTFGAILTVSFLTALVGFLVFCTVCDFLVKAKTDSAYSTLRTLAKFSLYTNSIKFWSTEIPPGTMPAINGIRFLSTLMIVTGHRLLSSLTIPVLNQSDVDVGLWQSWIAPSYHLLLYAPDTFFIIGGFLTAHGFLSKLRSGKKYNVPQAYIRRYLRLTPCVAALIPFVIYVCPHLGSGPIWQTIIGLSSEFCRKNWWTNLLYIHNYVNAHEMCLPHTWYIAVDIQLFWISPIILYPLFYRPNLGRLVLKVLLIFSCIVPIVRVALNQYSSIINPYKTFQQKYEIFHDHYVITHNRAIPYLVGIFLGHYIVSKEREFSKLQASLGWVLTCFFMAFCFWNATIIQPISPDYNVIGEVGRVSIGRVVWSLSVAWLIYACTQGHGGPITKILSSPIFVPLAKLGYTIYLGSAMIQMRSYATIRVPESVSILHLINMVWSDLAMSIIGAFVLHLCVETPVAVLIKILRAKRSASAINKRASGAIRKVDDLSTLMREYLDLTRRGVESNEQIVTKMSQPDFWEAVSAVLPPSSERATKTPAEWQTMWQISERDSLKKDEEPDTRIQDIENSSVQYRTGMSKLERELLLFLAVVMSFEESKTEEISTSSAGFCILQNRDLDTISKKKM